MLDGTSPFADHSNEVPEKSTSRRRPSIDCRRFLRSCDSTLFPLLKFQHNRASVGQFRQQVWLTRRRVEYTDVLELKIDGVDYGEPRPIFG